MRARGWSWAQLMETPQNVLDYLAMIDDWSDRSEAATRATRLDPHE